MSLSPGKAVVVAVAALAGPAVAVALAAGGPEVMPVTIGSTTGTPSQNICPAMINCTYLPYVGPSTPELLVPLNGAVTSFAVNSGSATGTVELRVLQPAGAGQFKAVASSPAEALTGGPQSFGLSLPLQVQAGDVLALDNSTSALLFDTTTSTDTAWYYYPALANGATGASNNQKAGYRLLVSAVIQPSPTTTITVTSGTTTTTITVQPPTLSHVSQTNKTWRLGSKLATITSKKPPVGTTFKFDVNQPAAVSFAFTQLFAGRKVKGKCVPQSSHNLHAGKCTRYGRTRSSSFNARAGADKLTFDGRVSRSTKLGTGNYKVAIQARNFAGQRSKTATLEFTIAS